MSIVLLGCYLLVGAVVGLLSGLLGVGGGIVIVPCLSIILSYQHVPSAVLLPMVFATSLAIIAVTSLSSLWYYCRQGHQIWDIYVRLFLGLCCGVCLGVFCTVTMPPVLLRALFGIFLIVVSGLLAMPLEPVTTRTLPGRWGLSSVFFLIGLKSGLFGVGGGIITTPYLLYCNVPVRRAFAVACATSATISVIGVLVFSTLSLQQSALPFAGQTLGYIYWPAFVGIAAVSPFVARYGVKCAHLFSTQVLRRILAVFIFIAGIDMLLQI